MTPVQLFTLSVPGTGVSDDSGCPSMILVYNSHREGSKVVNYRIKTKGIQWISNFKQNSRSRPTLERKNETGRGL